MSTADTHLQCSADVRQDDDTNPARITDDEVLRFAPDTSARAMPRRRERVTSELKRLTDAVLPGRLGTSREVSEGLVRLIGLVARLHEEHQADATGRCLSCGRWRRCPVLEALSVYLSPWLDPTPSPRVGRSGRAGHVRRAL